MKTFHDGAVASLTRTIRLASLIMTTVLEYFKKKLVKSLQTGDVHQSDDPIRTCVIDFIGSGECLSEFE